MRANVLLDSIERVLNSDGLFIDPLALSYLNVVQTAVKLGYTVERVELSGSEARLLVTQGDATRADTIMFVLNGRSWTLAG